MEKFTKDKDRRALAAAAPPPPPPSQRYIQLQITIRCCAKDIFVGKS